VFIGNRPSIASNTPAQTVFFILTFPEIEMGYETRQTPYIGGDSKGGLLNAAKDLLLVANARSSGTELLRHVHFNWAINSFRAGAKPQ
jgi:hypothetical protein